MATYSDLDLAFNIHPIKKDLSISTDTQAIIRSVKNIVLTNHYEVPFNPEFGSNIRKLLFEPVSVLTANHINKEIETVLTLREPRIKIERLEVTLSPDQNRYSVHLVFSTVTSTTPVTVDFFLTKLR